MGQTATSGEEVRQRNAALWSLTQVGSACIFNQMVKYNPLDATFAALSDPTRRAILECLSQENVPAAGLMVTSLAKPFDMSLPAISKHLKVLDKAGLLVRKRDGRIHRCSLDAAPMWEAARWISEYRKYWENQLGSLAGFLEEFNTQEEE